MQINNAAGANQPTAAGARAKTPAATAAEATPKLAQDGFVRSSDAVIRDRVAERCLDHLAVKDPEQARKFRRVLEDGLADVRRHPGETDAAFVGRLKEVADQLRPGLEWDASQAAYLQAKVNARIQLGVKYEEYAAELAERHHGERMQQARAEANADYAARATLKARELKRRQQP